MKKNWIAFLIGILTLSLILAACAPQAAPTVDSVSTDSPAAQADLGAVKAYAVEQASLMKDATASLRAKAEKYYAALAQIKSEQPEANPYEVLWANHPDAVKALIEGMRADWMTAHNHYESNEGIIAGVPSLAYYDAWIDAGPPASEDPEAVQWTLTLADGKTLESPGNLFHTLGEPILYGTVDEYIGLAVDLNGDGNTGLSEALPEAEMLLATAQALDIASGQMLDAVNAWQPTMEDAFMAMATMIPTMNEYFEQWKLSSFVSGDASVQISFVAASRLLDVTGILQSLDLTYDNVRPVVGAVDSKLDEQIAAGFTDLVAYVGDLYTKEKAGTVFTPEEADAFGTEAQDKATALAALVVQAAAKANIALDLEAEGWSPDSPPAIEAIAPAPAPIE